MKVTAAMKAESGKKFELLFFCECVYCSFNCCCYLL